MRCPNFAFAETERKTAHYYGPFAQAGMLRSTLSEMPKEIRYFIVGWKAGKIKGRALQII